MAAARSRRTIGVFTAQLDDAYQAAVWRGIERRARELGAGVVCFLGHRIGSPVPAEAAANIAYRIAARGNVDGLIVVSTAIATFLDAGGTERLFTGSGGMPQVSVGLKVPGIPAVTSEGTQGVAAVVRHLAREHGIRRFALIGGPAGHPEAEERSRAFRETLREEGIPFDEALSFGGTFVRASGAEAARRLLAAGRSFDALVCMSDGMALGAIDVLRAAGIRVPGDAAVTGFDGIEEGRYLAPPLTTVVQPLRGLGASAVDLLLELLDGRPPRDVVLSCTPAVRQSCGCPPRRSYDADLRVLPAGAPPGDRAAVEELSECAVRGDADGFIARLGAALASPPAEPESASPWNDYLSVIRAHADPEGRAYDLFESARVLVGESESRRQAARRMEAEERLAVLRTVGSSLAGAFEMPAMLALLDAGLSRLGIDGCFLVLFQPGDPAAAGRRLVMARRGGRAMDLPAGGMVFDATRLLPARAGSAMAGGTWVVEPLVFHDEPLGYLVLPGGASEPAVYETLREQLASALKGTMLLEQVRSHERRLEEEVARRTAELTRANRELTREIERRKKVEREVTEVSNRTMQRIGQDLHDDLCQHLAGVAMLAKAHRGGLPEGSPGSVDSIDRILALLSDSIARAKQIARGLYPAGLEEHGLTAAVEELVESARGGYEAAIDFRASPDFALSDTYRALQVYRIVQEALTNALKHSCCERISVRLTRERDASLVAEVSDNGKGFPRATREGMGLRIMRYRAETAGADLRIESLDPGTRISCRLRSVGGVV